MAGVQRQAAGLLQRAAVGAGVAPRVVQAEGRHGQHHHARVHLAQRRIVQPQLGQHLGRIVLHHRIGAMHQLLEQALAFGLGQVQGDAELAPVHQVEVRLLLIQPVAVELFGVIGAAPPVRVAGAFHLDDFSPQVGQHARGKRPGPAHGQVHHAQPGQRQLACRRRCPLRHGTLQARRAVVGTVRPQQRRPAAQQRPGRIQALRQHRPSNCAAPAAPAQRPCARGAPPAPAAAPWWARSPPGACSPSAAQTIPACCATGTRLSAARRSGRHVPYGPAR
jgi:hypothetical protein